MFDKKKAIEAILEKLDKKEEDSDMAEMYELEIESEDENEDLDIIVEDILEAIKQRNHSLLKDALEALVTICKD